MSSIVVTGGSGFIGSHLVDALLSTGHQVTIFDVDTPRFGQSCSFMRGDILDLHRLIDTCKGIEFVYNLAAEANVNRFYESPLFSHAVTTQGVLHVLEAARRAGVRRVLQASTEWVYGSAEGSDPRSITEEEGYAQNPDHVYTSSKIAAEMFVKNYHQLYGVDFTIARFGIPFGERARLETVTPTFLRRILRDEEIIVHGDGKQTRQFIYVKDLAAGCVACLNEAAKNQIFNLNGAQKISVLEIIETLESLLKKKARVRFAADRSGNFSGRFISSEKAKKVLGWHPHYSYRDAMSRYVEWFLKNGQF